MTARVADAEQDGHLVLVLRDPAAQLEAAFCPGAGMVGCSLRHRGDELLGLRKGLDAYARTGSTMGIPLLYPWANRLSGFEYRAAGRSVRLDARDSPLRLDPHGLPIHGLLAASPYWEVEAGDSCGDEPRVRASLDFGAHDELLRGFPFPHRLEQDVRLAEGRLTISTALRATGDVGVPVSFGYHPYLQLPNVPRPHWEVSLGVRRRALLDDRGIPTGRSEPCSIPAGPLGQRTFDDLFDALADPPEFALSGGGRRIAVRFEEGYAFAQVYAPPDQDVVCFEPMTAPTNALVTGDGLTVVPPGGDYAARFSIAVS